MFETGRRSAISSSELGLYSDRADRYSRSKYGPVLRKFVIGIMTIVAAILAAIFIYDFASGASVNSKVSQETKHIYMLQNTLKKPIKISTTSIPKPEVDKLTSSGIQDRFDDDGNISLIDTNNNSNLDLRSINFMDLPQMRSQSLKNFKLRKQLLDTEESDTTTDQIENKKLFNNHAVVYRVRQMYEHPENEDNEKVIKQESEPSPFHVELKTPYPITFKRLKFPQLSQYRYSHTSRSIQDVIKYLTNNPEVSKHGFKFSGLYMKPKKYNFFSDANEIMENSDKSEMPTSVNSDDDEVEEAIFSGANDPFYQYKPKHPADVNLLAPTNRFSSKGVHRYNNYYEPIYHRPMIMINKSPMPNEQNYDNIAVHSGNFGQKRKAKPFSVMLDIYPITDLHDHPRNTKFSRPRPTLFNLEEHHDTTRPTIYGRGKQYYSGSNIASTQPIPIIALPASSQHGISEEDEKKQMIFHLNLYPRKKSTFTRNDILQRSETMHPEDRQEFVEKIISPLSSITKQLTDHSAIERSNIKEIDAPTNSPLIRYEKSILEMIQANDTMNNDRIKSSKNVIPPNHKNIGDEEAEKTPNDFKNANNELINSPTTTINVDTLEGFQKFAERFMTSN